MKPVELAGAAEGVRDVVGELAGLGWRGWADEGRGTVLIGSGAGPIGHAGLGEAFAAFCTRWEWGVRAAVRTGKDIADGLAASAQAYEQGEDSSTTLLDRIVADFTGDPRSDPAAAPPIDQPPAPETGQDWQHTAAEAAATWSATAKDVWTNSTPGMVQRAVDGENPLQDQLDDLAGLTSGGSPARIGR